MIQVTNSQTEFDAQSSQKKKGSNFYPSKHLGPYFSHTTLSFQCSIQLYILFVFSPKVKSRNIRNSRCPEGLQGGCLLENGRGLEQCPCTKNASAFAWQSSGCFVVLQLQELIKSYRRHECLSVIHK